jgi:hypothetical protein
VSADNLGSALAVVRSGDLEGQEILEDEISRDVVDAHELLNPDEWFRWTPEAMKEIAA